VKVLRVLRFLGPGSNLQAWEGQVTKELVRDPKTLKLPHELDNGHRRPRRTRKIMKTLKMMGRLGPLGLQWASWGFVSRCKQADDNSQ
jgi:hypothetical protein